MLDAFVLWGSVGVASFSAAMIIARYLRTQAVWWDMVHPFAMSAITAIIAAPF